MVSDEIVKFRVERSTIWIADGFIRIRTAKTRSDLYRKAVTEQIGVDLLAFENGEQPQEPEEELPKYTSRYAEESELQSVRLSKTICTIIDNLIENGFAKNRSEYLRRAIEQFLIREHERKFGGGRSGVAISEEDIRRISREETAKYHQAAGTYFA